MPAEVEDKIIEIEAELASHYARQIEATESRASDQLIKVSGWLTASLLAVNGGGAVAALQAAEKIASPAWPLGAFGAGLILAMLSAVAIQTIQALMASPLGALIRAWNTASVRGKFSSKEMFRLKADLERVARWSWVAPTLGWLSGIAFLVGGFWLIAALPGSTPAAPRLGSARNAAPDKPNKAPSPVVIESQQVRGHKIPAHVATSSK